MCVYPKQEKDFHNDTFSNEEMPSLLQLKLRPHRNRKMRRSHNIGRYFPR